MVCRFEIVFTPAEVPSGFSGPVPEVAEVVEVIDVDVDVDLLDRTVEARPAAVISRRRLEASLPFDGFWH